MLSASQKKWFYGIVEKSLEKDRPQEEELKELKPKKVTSKLQMLIQDFYNLLDNANGDADVLDTFFQDYIKDAYKEGQRWRFYGFLDQVLELFNLQDYKDCWKTPELQKEAFFQIGEKVSEERGDGQEFLAKLKAYINKTYDNLISEAYQVTDNDLEAHFEQTKAKTLQELEYLLEQEDTESALGESQFKEYLSLIEEAQESQIEDIAEKIDEVIILGQDIWELLLYSTLTPFAPKCRLNDMPTRSNSHVLIIGEISTAKSRILNFLKEVAPKATPVSKFTEASLEGVAKRDYIEKGILDDANNGVLIIPEFVATYTKYRVMREALDCDMVTIVKGGLWKKVEVNTTLVGACNPKLDFFNPRFNTLREQIEFKEGIISRFDVAIPLTVSPAKNEDLLDRLTIMRKRANPIDIDRIKPILSTLAQGMINVQNVEITEKQEHLIKMTFRQYNVELTDEEGDSLGRPLLLMRDMETLVRLINVVATSNFPNRTIEAETLYAEDTDVLKAIELWETLINYRKQFYGGSDKDLLSVEQHIIKEVLRHREIGTLQLQVIITKQQNLCSPATFYRKVADLVKENYLHKEGERNSILSAIA